MPRPFVIVKETFSLDEELEEHNAAVRELRGKRNANLKSMTAEQRAQYESFGASRRAKKAASA